MSADPEPTGASERLDRRLERGAVEIDEVVAIARMLATYLDAEHAAGKTDGAIVPARVEVRTAGGEPKLLPATDEDRDVKAYTAPEAWNAPSTAGSDQFAMAAVLYEALCGGRAFPGDAAEDIRASITTGSRVPLAARVPGLADAVDSVFERALSVIGAERYESCTVFADALVAAIVKSREAAGYVLVQKPASSRPGSNRPLLPPHLDEWAPESAAPIPWIKVALGLVMLAFVAAALAVISGK